DPGKRELSGFDVSVTAGRKVAQELMIDREAAHLREVKPLLRQGSRRQPVRLTNAVLQGGVGDAPGRILLMNPLGENGKCGVRHLALRNITGGSLKPELDAFDDCPGAT